MKDDDNEEIEVQKEIGEAKTVANTNDAPKRPNRYFLFDGLVATIVEYDKDNNPIVEFALSEDKDKRLPIECGICPNVMPKSKLAKHLRKHQTETTDRGIRRWACIYCDETYQEHKYLAGHVRVHLGIRPYCCEPCKCYFFTKRHLHLHNQTRHYEKEHICEICGRTFAHNALLKKHRESAHDKLRRFKCDQCSKAYYKSYTLREHVRNVHLGTRRMIVCPFCGMECFDAHKMARHRKEMHLSQTHFHCNICQEEFTDILYFDAHKRSIICKNNTRRKMEEEGIEKQQKKSADD